MIVIITVPKLTRHHPYNHYGYYRPAVVTMVNRLAKRGQGKYVKKENPENETSSASPCHLRQLLSCQHGDEAQGEAAEDIEHHIGVLSVLHQRRSFVHKCGESGEATTEACGEQKFGGWRHQSAVVPVESRQETDDEASQHVHRHGAKGEGEDGA